MAEIKYKDYKLKALSELVTIDVSLNPKAIGLSDAEARQKKLWLNTDTLPTEQQIRDKFNELKPKLQKKADREQARELQAKESDDNSEEFEDLFDDLYDQDEDLGLNGKQLNKFAILVSLGKKKKALNLLKKSKLLKGE